MPIELMFTKLPGRGREDLSRCSAIFPCLPSFLACICFGNGKVLGPTTSDIFLIAAAASLVVAVILSSDG
jgi:hypothetical protein